MLSKISTFLKNILAILSEIQKLSEMEENISEQIAEKVSEKMEEMEEEMEEMEEKIMEQVSIIAAAVSENCKFRFFIFSGADKIILLLS